MKYDNIETERLILKLTDKSHAQFMLKLFNTPKYFEFVLDRKIRTEEQAKDYILNKLVAQHRKHGFGNYTVMRKVDNIKMGSCGLYSREGIEGVDIGFAFLPEYEGQGYAYEASKALIQLAFDEIGLREVKGITSRRNPSSQGLLRKLGLKEVGTIVLPPSEEELLLFSLRAKLNDYTT